MRTRTTRFKLTHQTPVRIDLATTYEGDPAVLTTRGICTVNADGTLTYCITNPGQPRPPDFETRRGDGRTVVTLRRFDESSDIGVDPPRGSAFPGWQSTR